MEKILATLYLIGVFFTACIFVASYVGRAISRWMKRNKAVENQPEPVPEPDCDIVGKSKSVLLVPLVFEKHEPAKSEALVAELVSAAEIEPDISPDDVDITLMKSYVPGDDELGQFRNDDVDIPEVFSQGLTYQQISQAIDVMEGKKSGVNEELIAGETFSLMPSDFLDLICLQTNYEMMVKSLIAGYENSIENMKPIPATVADFDIKNYV